MKKYLFILLVFSACGTKKNIPLTEEQKVDKFLTQWHKAAAEANFNNYFEAFTEDAIFIGTDATENWNKTAFQAFAKPYFDKGKAWNFTKLQRNIFFSSDKKIVWFDELLNTQMKICRGSGVLIKTEQGWKIKHYVLSMTIPNDDVDAVVKIKSHIEDILIKDLKK
jgi:hypothetical protein